MCDVVWDKPFIGGCSLDGLCPERRGYRIPQYSLLKLAKYSKERRKERSRSPINDQKSIQKHEPIRIASRNESQNNRHRPPPRYVYRPRTTRYHYFSRPQEPQSVDILDRLFAASKATAEAPIKATNLIKNSNSSSGTQNLAKTIFNQSGVLGRRDQSNSPDPMVNNKMLMNGNPRYDDFFT